MKVKNKIRFFKSLGGQAILVISLLIIFISLILSFFFTNRQKNFMEEELKKRCSSLANNLSYNSQYWVMTNYQPGLQQLISGIMKEKEIIYAIIIDNDGTIIGNNDTFKLGEKMDIPSPIELFGEETFVKEKILEDTKEKVIEIMSPIKITPEKISENEELLFSDKFDSNNIKGKGVKNLNTPPKKLLGIVYLGVSTKNLNEAISEIQKKAFVITFGIILIGIILTIVMIRFVTQPLRKLMDATKIIAQGNLDHYVEIKRKDEIGVLAQSFNQMTGELKKSREEIENWNKELEAKVVERTKELSEKHKELKIYSEKLQKAYEELKTLDKSKDDFLALVSHELRTPLSSIVAYTEVLLDDMAESKEEEKNYLGIIKSESDRLTRLINNVLDLSKMEAGRMPFEFNYVNLNKLVNASVRGLAGAAIKHKHKLINNLENSSIIIFADEDKIIQVLSNILSNAIKFTQEGGIITISGDVKYNNAEISISDTGHGIKKEDFNKVFDKFQQIEEVNHHSEGTGLGMPISKIIVENHKGKIWFESKVGQGTTFYFTIPIKKN